MTVIAALVVVRAVMGLATLGMDVGEEPPPAAATIIVSLGVAAATLAALYFVATKQSRVAAWIAIGVTVIDLLLALPVFVASLPPLFVVFVLIYIAEGIAMILMLRRREVWSTLK